MKKLYTTKPTKRIHPSPPSPSSLLSSLPAALLALAAALSPHDQETLAYLLGCEKPNQTHKQQQQQRRRHRRHNHPPELGCSCFGCYTSFWARWDSSPNRHVIHLIIDAFEETLELSKSKDRGKKRKRGKKKKDEVAIEENVSDEVGHEQVDDGDHDGGGGGGDDDDDDDEVEDGEGKSSVRRFVSWVFGMNE